MAALPIATRTLLWQGLMQWWSEHSHALEQPFSGISKADIYNPTANTGLIAQLDDWMDTHQGNTGSTVGVNGAIQEPCKSNLTVATKGFVLALVVLARYNPEMARQVIGG